MNKDSNKYRRKMEEFDQTFDTLIEYFAMVGFD
jgi:hypothetical protein